MTGGAGASRQMGALEFLEFSCCFVFFSVFRGYSARDCEGEARNVSRIENMTNGLDKHQKRRIFEID